MERIHERHARDFDHRGAAHPDQHSGGQEGGRNRGERQVPENVNDAPAVTALRIDTRGREQPEIDGEHDDQDHPEPERRQADAGKREDQGCSIEPAIGMEASRDAQAPARDNGEHHAAGNQQQGVEQLGRQQLDHRHVKLHRPSEVAAHGAQGPLSVLDDQRLVEPVALADLISLLLGGERSGEMHDGISRHQPHGQEHDDGNAEQQQDEV